jgi:hypothetical protein
MPIDIDLGKELYFGSRELEKRASSIRGAKSQAEMIIR